jgi:hypothetical protein
MKKTVKQHPLLFFVIVYAIANAGLILYGLLALARPNLLLESFSVHVYRFPPDATFAVRYLSALFRLLGLFNLILGVLGLFLLWRYRINHQPWLVYTVIALTVFSYLGPIILDNTVGNIGFFEIIEHIIFIIMFLSAISLLFIRDQIVY